MNFEHQLNGELARAASPALAAGRGLRSTAAALGDARAGDQSVADTLLERIAADRDLAAAVAADSYWHSNGFAKLNLLRSPQPELRLRLHVWPGRGTRPVAGYENIHSHRWAFASLVLCGQLEIDEFEETDLDDPRGEVVEGFAYATPAGASTGDLRPTGRTALRSIATYRYEAGDVHRCDTAVVHTVSADDLFTATMVVQGPAEVDEAWVFQRADRAVLKDTGIGLTADDVTELVTATLTAMHENAAVETCV